ncbi:peptidoglycan-binding protein [Microvirga sp. 3-52]|uniref:peptidoglycan-binding domain-containing protein n=1 Tax=Microvirga sp. 3-52 TaxID=2792425 RepID=UPI001AC1274E|nr:peptidoglycan-binding protein [Microvirga sp. 3-52]
MNRLTIALALVGWALYGFSFLGPRSSEAGAQAEITRLSQAAETASADRDALAVELERFKERHQDLQNIQKQIAAATQELKHLEYLRARVSGEIDTLRPQPSGGSAQAAAPEETVSPQVGPAPPAEVSLPPSKEEVRRAQQTLTILGYGPLKADGVSGPGTRRSIEAFQQGQGLPVTGQLDADTVRALRTPRTAAQP